ncbi:uncharacterized protein Trissin isoform X2 [Eurosta solidaginis]|uniref:uncharacterized protein Trissin isoform X2 n=1 Tax=Eurosta solidaginis TaxID=178769 RepID=UPI003530DAA5
MHSWRNSLELHEGIFTIFLNTTMTTHAFHSPHPSNMIDGSRYDLEPNSLIEKKSAFTCDSCGNECTNACGTKNFRTCCFNYLRKRNDPNIMKSISNQHLIDSILLQGRASIYSLAERNRSNGDDDENADDGKAVIGMFRDENKLTPVRNEGRIYRENIHHTII